MCLCRYFKYQVANVLIIVLAGSLFGTLSEAIDNPGSIASILGSALPGVSVFFINFIITQLLSGVPSILFRYIPWLILKLYQCCFDEKSVTRRMLLEGPLAQVTVDYGVELPPLLNILFIMMIYGVMAPILLVVATLYFGATYVAWKYQYLFVIVPDNEGGGRFWYGIFDYSMVGLLVSTVTMVGYMGIKEGIAQAPLTLPLPVIVLVAWSYTDSKFKKLSQNLPYSSAVDVDTFSPMVQQLTQSFRKISINAQQVSARIFGSTNEEINHDIPTTTTTTIDESPTTAAIDSESDLGTSYASSLPDSHSHASSFTADFCVQANVKETNPVYPYPYRLTKEPLFLENGNLNPIYYRNDLEDKEIEIKLIRKVAVLNGFVTTDEENYSTSGTINSLVMNDDFSGLNKPLLAAPTPPTYEVKPRQHHHQSHTPTRHSNAGSGSNGVQQEGAGLGVRVGEGDGGAGSVLDNDKDRQHSTNSQYSEIAGSWD